MTDQTFQFDSDFGARYDAFVRQMMFAYEPMFPMILAFLATRLGEKARILVVGSGTGMELVSFGSKMPQWTFTGVEPAEQMLRVSRAKLESFNLTERVRLHHGFIDSLVDSESYDAATLTLVLHFVPDNGAKQALLQAIADRLKPGACLTIIDLGSDPHSQSSQNRLASWKKYLNLNGLAPAEVEKRFETASQTQYFIPEERLMELLAETGFVNVERFYQAFLNTGWIAQKA